MKKLSVIIMAVIMVASALVMSVSAAQTYNPNEHCDIEFMLKKADPANVIKDGIIGEYEYERLALDVGIDTTSLNMAFPTPAGYLSCEEVLPSVEFYFSWDEVHGFNFAERFKPTEASNKQVLDISHGDIPKDDFLGNVGFMFTADPTNPRTAADEMPMFFFALAKRTTDGQYLEGHYNQLGLKGNYDPTPEVDYTINYEAGGTVLIEWSIPFDNFLENASVGQNVYFSTSMSSGECEDINLSDDERMSTAYSISLGDYGYLVDQRNQKVCRHAVATISDELIAAAAPDTTTPGTTPDSNPDTDNPGTEPGKNTDPVDSNNPGTDPADSNNPGTDPVNPADPTNPSNPTNPTNPTNPSNPGKAPSTADPIVIAAIASAISACGFMVSKKRK